MYADIAVVGIACRYPDAADAGAFWSNLVGGSSGIREVGSDNWDADRFYSAEGADAGRINTKWVGALDGSRNFDHAFFSMSPREAVALDPQTRILLEETWHCIEDSGLPIESLRRSRSSVNVGLMAQDYLIQAVANNNKIDAFDPIGNYPCMASNRISYCLDLNGPSRTVDTACSSSLVALSQGRRDLLHEDCEFALVAGVNLINSPWRYLAFTQSRMLSPDGRCFTFDSRANGYVPGEGAGVVLLTSLENAERLGCHVYGVLKSVATNHNGHNRNLTAPKVDAQVDVIRRALAEARIDPAQVQYVEAHGTGTSLGDPIEVEALDAAYCGIERSAPLAVGSVKTNIGHVEAGAGMAGLIKVLLMIGNKTIAPTLNIDRVNPVLEGIEDRMEFPGAATPWRCDGPRSAGISSFGFGGVNSHAIVQEYQSPSGHISSAEGPQVFTLSAKSSTALCRTMDEWATRLHDAIPEDRASLCRASNQRDTTLPYRFAARADDVVAALARERAEPARCAEPSDLSILLSEGEVPATDHAAVAAHCADIAAEAEVAMDDAAMAPFIVGLAYLRVLADRGIEGAELGARSAASAAAVLVHARMLPIDAAVRTLRAGTEFCSVASPVVAVWVAGERVLPNEFTADYLAALADGSAREREIVARYAAHAAGLLDHQFTFARAISRWENQIQAHGFSLVAAIRDFEGYGDRLSSAQRAMIGLAVDSARAEIDRAWGLTSASWLEPITHELAELVNRGIVPPADALSMIAATSDLAELAARGRAHRDVRTSALDLPLLRERSVRHHRAMRFPVSATDVTLEFEPLNEGIVLLGPRTGATFEPGDASDASARTVHVDPSTAAGFVHGLIDLWCMGHGIDWAGAQTGLRRIPGLPGYRFDPHVHWHDDQALRLDGRIINDETESSVRVDAPGFADTEARQPESAPARSTGSPDVLAAQLRFALRELIAEATKTSTTLVNDDTLFADLGIDSLIIHALNVELGARFGEVSATLFFECQDVRSLGDRLLRDYLPAVSAHFSDRSATEAAAAEVTATEATASVPVSTVPDAPAPNRSRRAAHGTLTRRAVHRGVRSAGHTGDACAPIAIIGLDGRFPGADTLDQFWTNLCDGVDSIREVPKDRWDHDRYYDPDRGVSGKVYAKWGGFLSDVDRFAAADFGINPVEAQFMDPQERLFLESAQGCLEVAGYSRDRLAAGHANAVGVFVGASFNNYQLIQHEADLGRPGGPVGMINSQMYAIANRVSYTFDLHGPSMTVDTACSSSLYAIHQACESLRRNECSLALAGGVNLSLHPSKYQMLAKYQFLSSDGRCRAFGDGGDGYVPAETVGSFLLKPLDAAEHDGDFIYGVIRGSALSHGGRTNGFTVPNPAAQAASIERALHQAGTDPASISYIEAHGTGTRLGDPIEIAGLTAAFEGAGRGFCAIGSVKSNIGHGEAAAGVAQVAKVVLQMQHRTLVPSLLHSDRINPAIDFAKSPVYVQRDTQNWEYTRKGHGSHPLRAGVTSIGAGGTNVHLVMEEYC